MAKHLPAAVFTCAAPRGVELTMELQQLDRDSGAADEREEHMLEEAPAVFSYWKAAHAKEYHSVAEEQARYMNFINTLEEVAAHNQAGDSSYRLGLNEFADMSWEEFKMERLGAVGAGQNCSATHTGSSKRGPHAGAAVPAAIDWREKGAVSPVKNQGRCGSCWTFSTTGCLESHHFLATGEMVLLSEQQLVDCAQAYDNKGCNGGLPSHAFEYVHAAGGLDTELAYPYTAKDGECAFKAAGIGATVQASYNITFQDEKELQQAVGSVGPVAVAFEVASDFKSYAGGVYDNPACDDTPDKVNHAVLAVGYGTDAASGQDYWLIKNSWGPEWGEAGYFRMKLGVNRCGIADCASYPVV